MCMKHYAQLRRTGSTATTRYMGDFWSKVKKGTPEECWPWLGYVKPSGHGLTSIRGLMMHTSRKAWILTHGHIADNLNVLHKCDNAICCNPTHMYLGTRTDNMVDAFTNRPFDERIAGSQSRKLSKVQLAELWQMRRGGAKLKECAAKFEVHIGTICRYITEVRKEKLEKLQRVRLGPAMRN